ncbi:MAG: DsrE family protein [Acidobacteria bacterium]|nr:DsrE family protein [Acidobacteriota bacterium]
MSTRFTSRLFSSFLALGLMASLPAVAADDKPKDGKPYHAVFEVSNGDVARLQGVIRNVDNLRRALGPEAVSVEVVVHGGAILTLTKEKAGVMAADYERLSKEGVVWAACNNSLVNRKIDKSALLPFVTVVPSGVAELVKKQAEGWQYLRNSD